MTIAMRINGERLKFMTDLPTWQHFGKGWARRIAENPTSMITAIGIIICKLVHR